MHAMKLHVQALRRRSRAARAEPCHWAEGRHNNVGVSLRERRAKRQVMLGVSLRARWDATLVDIISNVRRMKWSWVGHINCLKDDRWTSRINTFGP